MKVLVVGGAGYVGSILQPALQAEHDYYCFDQCRVEGLGDRSLAGDLNDDVAVKRAVKGMQSIVYLAMENKKRPRDLDQSFNINTLGVYRLLTYSLKAGVRHFVYASSMSVYRHLWKHDGSTLDESTAPNAWDPYGLGKRLGEHVCQAAAQHYPRATIIALRLITPCNDEDFLTGRRRKLVAIQTQNAGAIVTAPNDLRRLFLAAIKCSQTGAHIVQATGDLDNRKFPNHRVAELLDWRPRGD